MWDNKIKQEMNSKEDRCMPRGKGPHGPKKFRHGHRKKYK